MIEFLRSTVRLDVCGARRSPWRERLRQQLPPTHAYVLHYYPVAVPSVAFA